MKALVLIPTFNERENLPALVALLLALPNIHVLVIDDRSPDGTGTLADGLARDSGGRVQVLHRTGERGLGRSYLDGFRVALGSDADIICQMDADFSHDPKFLPAMLETVATGAELVIGSRYCEGGGVENWPLHRQMLSAFANRYIRTITGLQVHDCTTAFRCWQKSALARLPLASIGSEGYSFLVEVTFLAAKAHTRIVEVPIVFVERRLGASKLSWRVLSESLATPWRLAAAHGRIRSR